LFRGAELPDTFYSIAYIYEESPCLVTYVTKNCFTVSINKPPTQSALSNLGFVLGKAKLAPPSEHSIPRLELCAVVLAVEAACQCKTLHCLFISLVVPVRRTVQLLQLELLHTIPSEEWNVHWEVQVLPFQERIGKLLLRRSVS
jgi:hypothetical protein